ncbi:hypothetical protein KTE91_25200 [Burkholderia multivorans]|uniref:hypothetical protein n=1 Tax=Burkholderia multivorans TaxID=87883 RepID=UPI001C223657|nr:hypothetical protein [Burkholderia multivorans]MBU9438389.1 hypothetical protein [Burkholderia multivorans]
MVQNSEIHPAEIRADIQKSLIERVDWFGRNYDVISHQAFGPGSEEVYLGDEAKHVCRYCDLASPQVKFRNLAHAIPDQIGNDWLFDYEECDDCNLHFSKYVEDDFAKWTLPWRSLGRIRGKNGVPSLKSNDRQFRIDATVNDSTVNELTESTLRYDLKIRMALNDARHELDEATKTVKLTLERQPYVPMGVFKCLVKMAIAVMPQEEEKRCDHLKKWILLANHTFESYRYKPLNILYQFAPGPLPNDRVTYWLLRRKPDGIENCAYMQFVLQLSNHTFQIALPMHIEDRTILEGGGTFETMLWPNTWAGVDHQMEYGRSGHQLCDMSGTDRVRGDTISMTFHYDQLIDAPEIAERLNGIQPKGD